MSTFSYKISVRIFMCEIEQQSVAILRISKRNGKHFIGVLFDFLKYVLFAFPRYHSIIGNNVALLSKSFSKSFSARWVLEEFTISNSTSAGETN